jgi:hypothetical protein
MISRLLHWGFPLYLIVVEMIFRAYSHEDTMGFIGPTIATAGLSALMPLTKAKPPSTPLSPSTLQALQSRGLMPVSAADQNLVVVVWLTIISSFFVWFWSCYVSLKEPGAVFLFVPKHITIGLINYFTAVILSALKAYL